MVQNDNIISFKNSLIKEFCHIQAVVLTGSFAKGDSTAVSDIDIWAIFNSLKIQDLKLIAGILANYSKTPEINVQCVSSNELLAMPFKKWFSPVQIYVDGIVLHGNLPPYIPYNSEIRNYAASIAAQVLMSSRHYISIAENEESLASGKLLKWVLKPLSWVLRYNALLRSSVYPRTFEDLLRHTVDSEEKQIISAYSEIQNQKYKGSFVSLNEMCHTTALKLSTI